MIEGIFIVMVIGSLTLCAIFGPFLGREQVNRSKLSFKLKLKSAHMKYM